MARRATLPLATVWAIQLKLAKMAKAKARIIGMARSCGP